MRFFTVVLFLLPLHGLTQSDPFANRVFTREEMQEDFSYLRRILEETHPGLYRYTPKHVMQAKLDSTAALLHEPMGFYRFYRILSHRLSTLRCAHTHIIPLSDFESFYTTQIKTFPLMIFFTQGKYYITVNGTADPTIKPGFELLSINGKPVNLIRNEMQNHLWADGYNQTGKTKALSEAFFPVFYYLLIDQPETFLLTLKDLNGKEMKAHVPAQYFKETQNFFKSNSVNKEILSIYTPKNKLDRRKGWRLTITEKENIGIIRINGFGGGKSEEEAQEKMKVFMDNCMKKLKKQNVQELVLDLRYNSGGWDIQGVELFRYFMEKPTRCYQRLCSITDSSEFLRLSDLSPEDMKNIKKELRKESDGTFSVREEESIQLQIQQPKENRFTGKVYVLANGASASTTSEFIAYAKSNQAITLIGEETGGAHEGGNGGSFLNFELPHSKVKIGTPLLYYENAVTAPELRGRGTMPDYAVQQNIVDLLTGADTQLNFVLKLIRDNRKSTD